ncbi:MAG: HAMP domain-containing sensor histidine kinase [Fusobacteria bacterium]|nr:HAMP domain-containing sensor histidine kinase [Fusobacteriota bacterium]
MNKIFYKVFMEMSFLVLLTVLIAIVLNTMFLDKFYYYKKINRLGTIANELVTTGFTPELGKKLESSDNVSVQIVDISGGTFLDYEIQNGIPEVPAQDAAAHLNRQGFAIMRQSLNNLNYALYFKRESPTKFYILRTSVDSIQQAVNIANEFFLYSGIVVLLLGVFLIYFFTRRITSPILEINDVIKRINKFDFSKKLSINTGDELQMLASNINKLSQDLETTIQELKIANEKLKDDIDKEKDLENQKVEFISNISHEVKTPITVINTYAEVIMEDMVPDHKTRKEYSQIIIDEGYKISKLLDDLSSYIKLGNLQFDIKKDIFDIQELIMKNLKPYQIDILEKNIELEVIPLKRESLVEGDRFRIEQVITNFLSNAVSHLNTNGKLNVFLFEKSDRILIEIENSGSKIEEQFLEDIWKPFFKIDKSRNRKYGGTGLGLAIVKNILEKSECNYGVLNTELGVKFWFDIKAIKIGKRQKQKREQ